MKRQSRLSIVTAAAVLAILGGTALYAQKKYSLKTPHGIEFSDFKGYEDWSVVSSARTDEVLKVIVANPVMIEAYKAGIPGNGRPFPEGGGSRSCNGSRRRARKLPLSSMCPTSSRRRSSSKRTASGFRTAADGAMRYSTTMPHPTSSRPIRAPRCGHSCHVAVKAKDHFFHPYQKR